MVASRAEVRDGSVSTGFDLYGYFLQRRPFGSCLIISMSSALNGAKNRPKFIWVEPSGSRGCGSWFNPCHHWFPPQHPQRPRRVLFCILPRRQPLSCWAAWHREDHGGFLSHGDTPPVIIHRCLGFSIQLLGYHLIMDTSMKPLINSYRFSDMFRRKSYWHRLFLAFCKHPARQLMAMGHLAAGYVAIAAMESFCCSCCFTAITIRILSLHMIKRY